MPDYVKRLNGETRPQPIEGTGISFAAPGLRGTLAVDAKPAAGEAVLATRSSLRDSGRVASNDEIDQAVQEVGVLDSYNLETDAATPTVTRADGTRAGTGGVADDEALIDYEPKPGEYSYVIYRDEAGVISIHFPGTLPTGESAARDSGGTVRTTAGEVQKYRIQLRKPAPPVLAPGSESQTRFGIATIGKKLLKIVIGKAIKKAAGPLVGAADYGAVWIWEKRARAFQGFHGGRSSEALLAENPIALAATDWASLDGQKTLLFIHGTTSTTSGGFSGMDAFPGQRDALYGKYGGRVIGFNHHTMTASVADNVADFYSGLPATGTFNFDIVCHSRGGLVARALKEISVKDVAKHTKRPCSPTASVDIGKIVFVGTPNIGTQLADPKDIPHALDVLSNVSSLIPGAGLTLAAFFATAAFVAENGFAALPGLRDMNPTNKFLAELNQAAADPARSPLGDYSAIQSSFASEKLVNTVLLGAVKYLFKGNLNDLIVPTLGASNIDQLALPDSVIIYFGKAPKIESVAHTQYFQRQETWDFIVKQLTIFSSSN